MNTSAATTPITATPTSSTEYTNVASPSSLSNSSENNSTGLRHPRKRRSAWEIERLFPCEESSKCNKKYGSASALRTHVKKKHPERLESFDLRQSSPAKVSGKKSLSSLKPLPLSKFRVTSIGTIQSYLGNSQPRQPQPPPQPLQAPSLLMSLSQPQPQAQQAVKLTATPTRNDELADMALRSSFFVKCNLSPSPPLPPNPTPIEQVAISPSSSPTYGSQFGTFSTWPSKTQSKDSPQDIFPFLSCELEGWRRETTLGKLELFAKLSLENEGKERPDCLLIMMIIKEGNTPEGHLCMKINFADITNLTVEYGTDIVRFHIDTQSLQVVVNSRGGRLDATNVLKSQHLPKLTPKTSSSEDKKITLSFERSLFADFVPLLQKDQYLATKFHIARPITSSFVQNEAPVLSSTVVQSTR